MYKDIYLDQNFQLTQQLLILQHLQHFWGKLPTFLGVNALPCYKQLPLNLTFIFEVFTLISFGERP